MNSKRYQWPAAIGIGVCAWAIAQVAWAGIPECNNLRLEEVVECELRGDLQCNASCDELGVYEKACATRLTTECRQECTLDPNPMCTDTCTEQCSQDCDLGVNVICIHNCFGECVGTCDFDCELADDVERCRASCEATCDAECDVRCTPVVEESCYYHCIECCGGACTAQANMNCQTTCQEREFESCEYEFRADCQASCSGNGSLFCDGEYVLSGSEIPSCAAALVERGLLSVDLDAIASVDLGSGNGSDGSGSANANAAGRASCNAGMTTPAASSAAWVAVLGLLGGWLRRRRSTPA